MSTLGAAIGYTLGATIGINYQLRSSANGFVGPLQSLKLSATWPMTKGPMDPVTQWTPFAVGAVGAYMGYTQKIPILRDYV